MPNNSRPQPQFRMQKGEDVPPALQPNRPEPIRMPSPAELGLGCATAPKTDAVNWGDIRQRMERLNVSGFQLDRIPSGYRFTCVVPASGGLQRLTAEAVTEAEAIHQALARAE